MNNEKENSLLTKLVKALEREDWDEARLLIAMARRQEIDAVSYVAGVIYDLFLITLQQRADAIRNDRVPERRSYLNYFVRYCEPLGNDVFAVYYIVKEKSVMSQTLRAIDKEQFVEQEWTRIDWWFDSIIGEDDGDE